MKKEPNFHQIKLESQIEKLQKAKDELKARLKKYTDLYDFAPVGYLTLDREGTIQEANLTAARLLGIARTRLVKRPFGHSLSVADLPVFTAFLTKVFECKVRQFCEVTLLKEGKPPVKLRIKAVAVSGRECRAVMSNITEHKRAEAERLIMNKLEATGILAGGLAHDFNNLLTIILLNLELAQRQVPPAQEVAHRLEGAKMAASKASDLTQRLITFAEGHQLNRKLTSLSEMIEASVHLALSGSRVRCEFAMAEGVWPADVDAGQIRQVIRNLALNAREAMPEGGLISVRAENVVLGLQENPSLPPGDYVRVSVADQGGGISKEVLPKIFDPYFSTKRRGIQKGMGLGLTICHTIIQKHGGAIAVETVLGVGTTFHFYLPASRKLFRQ